MQRQQQVHLLDGAEPQVSRQVARRQVLGLVGKGARVQVPDAHKLVVVPRQGVAALLLLRVSSTFGVGRLHVGGMFRLRARANQNSQINRGAACIAPNAHPSEEL